MIVLLALAADAVPMTAVASSPPPIDQFVKHDPITDIELSPTGEYLAFTRRNKDRTALIVVRLSDRTQMGGIHHGRDTAITSLNWVGNDRITYSLAVQMGALSVPQGLGEIYAMNADGSRDQILVGRSAGERGALATRAGRRPENSVSAYLVDRLESSPNEVLVRTSPFIYSDVASRSALPESRLERMDIFSGRRSLVAKAPVAQADFLVDSRDEARFAVGSDVNNRSRLYYRADATSDWQLVNDQSKTSVSISPIGFAPGDKIAYLWSERAGKPDAIYSYDTETGKRELVAEDDNVDPWTILYSPFDESPFGVVFMDGLPRTHYFDPSNSAAKLHRSLQASFPGLVVDLYRAT